MADRGTPKPRSGDISTRFCRLISATLLVIVGAVVCWGEGTASPADAWSSSSVVSLTRPLHGPWMPPAPRLFERANVRAQTREKGKRMRTRRRLAVGAALLLALAAAVVGGVTRSDGVESIGARGEGELPTALGKHLDHLAKAYPGNPGLNEEGPSSAAESAFLERAFPAETISVDQMADARAAVAAANGRPFPSGKGRKGTWVSVGPSEALYPFEPFRNAFNYVPEQLCGRREDDVDRPQQTSCKPGDCVAYITPAGGGVWRTKNALDGQPNWEYLGGPLGINAAGYGLSSTPTTRVATRSTSAPARRTSAARAASPAPGSTSRPTAATRGRPHRREHVRRQSASARSSSSRATPTRSTPATTTALRGMSSVVLLRRDAARAGGRQVGPLQVDRTAARRGRFIHDGSANVADCIGRPDRVQQPANLLAARRAFAGTRPDEPGDRLRGLVRPRRLALAGRRRDAGRRSRRR